MAISPASTSLAPDLPFKYVGGDPSLDLVNTVDWTPGGLSNDRLVDYPAVIRWADGAVILSKREVRALREIAHAHPREAEAAYEAARRARWVLKRLFSSVVSGRIEGRSLADFNDILSDSFRRLGVGVGRDRPARRLRLRWSWRGMGEDLESPLWRVVWSAAGLLTSEEASRLRECDGPDCGWLFVDRSRNQLRRWCDMATCGTRAKSRRRAARSRGG